MILSTQLLITWLLKSPCAKIHGILLVNPARMRKIIIEGIYNIFYPSLKTKEFGTKNRLSLAACEYVHRCNRIHPDTGMLESRISNPYDTAMI